MTISDIRDAVAPYVLLIKVALVALLSASMFIGGCSHGASKWQSKYENEKAARLSDNAAHKELVDEMARRAARIAKRAADASKAAKAERAANDQRFKELTDEAVKARSALHAALRNGTARLRQEWTCPAARPAEGGASAATRGQDGEAQLRRAREEAILDDIADHDRSDTWIGWLQAELIATRTACGVVP